MNKIKILFFIVIAYLLYLNNYANSAINFTVSPIKYEIEAFTWTTVYRTAILRNNSNDSITIKTWKTDFQSSWKTWKPQFVRYSELVHPDQQLSTWIDIDIDSFIINPNEEKSINFTLSIPNDATPWWHYWAICFKNDKSEVSSWWNININVDYCIILLVNVDWEVITKWEIMDTTINNSWWNKWWWNSLKNWAWLNNLVKDDCPFIDLTASRYDWKCIDNFFEKENIDKLNLDDLTDLNFDDFQIDFQTVFINEWNTHLNPTWKITLTDENWNTLKSIWKETIKNEHWAKIWEKIVDYLPINDEWWNVLPGQKREFITKWEWFPYESYDENWKKIIKYWTPEEYYTRKNIKENWFLMPWERVNERINNEKIKANIDISYKNKEWEDTEFNSAKELNIYYKEKYVWINPYVCIWAFLFILIIFILWLIFRKKKRKCINCKKKIEKDMKICPYCLTEQSYCSLEQNRNSTNSSKP